ncbi:hypothetical protein HYS95_01310 [Candidatus Daviesbacteria bacterium]|nr:hypothetical protein [Candidatus Daviesbacteria bacterium]
MAFSKAFPRQVSGSSSPVWEEVLLSEEEEKEAEEKCQRENFCLLDASLQEAKALAIKHGINSGANVTRMAIALFEKKASHQVFWKEKMAKEKFERWCGQQSKQ